MISPTPFTPAFPELEDKVHGPLVLASHALCPYVQRAAIVALEKGITLDRRTIDLADKPAWFVERSPTGKVPMLMVGDETLFESSAIAEYLDEISGGGLLPADPLERARDRAWTDFASGTLADIGRLYGATEHDFDGALNAVDARFGRAAAELRGPWFGGERFGLVDAAFAPAFRYLDVFETAGRLSFGPGVAAAEAWRARLRDRPSVRSAVTADYPERLAAFLAARASYVGSRFREAALELAR